MAEVVLSQIRQMIETVDKTRSSTRIFPKSYEDVVQVSQFCNTSVQLWPFKNLSDILSRFCNKLMVTILLSKLLEVLVMCQPHQKIFV